MDKLKSSIEEANLAVDKEREKNVSLLHMIFPPNIAKRLWLGKYAPCNPYGRDRFIRTSAGHGTRDNSAISVSE